MIYHLMTLWHLGKGIPVFFELRCSKYSVTSLNRIALGPNFSAGLDRDPDYKGWNNNILYGKPEPTCQLLIANC